MNSFGSQRLLVISGVVILAIVVVIAIGRLTSGHPSASATSTDRCAIARKAVEAFDHGRPPPAEWIQDREAAAKAVQQCGPK